MRHVAFVIQSVNVQSCGQEVVWSVAFFVSVGQCPGRVLAFVELFFCKKIPLSRRVGYVMDRSMGQ